MPSIPSSTELEILDFVRDRLGCGLSLIPADCSSADLHDALSNLGCTITPSECTDCTDLVYCAEYEPLVIDLDPSRSFATISLSNFEDCKLSLVAVLDGSASVTRNLLRCAIEAYQLSQEIKSCNTALEESAIQLAQSFEEQNWLRGFARNATCFTSVSSANDVATGILAPLGYLLRAQDVFLLVEPEETERSGLTSTKFGSSSFSLETLLSLFPELGIYPLSPPVVRNNLTTQTADGMISSIICVSIANSGQSFGHLVAINRTTTALSDGLPVYDPEFGSGDVGLLEEAAVLLSTQAHNIHLLVQSNQLFLGTLHAMSSAIDARDRYTQGHSERVARLSYDLSRVLGLSDEACQENYLAGILHDIGKIGIPDSVLLKNGPLTDEEFSIIQQHPEIGHRIVEQLGHLQFVLPGVLYHHERWDGKGYPHQLAGQSIPLMARIMAVADAFDAMTSSRPYRSAMPVEKASSIIINGAAQQWDADIVDCFKIWVTQRLQEIPSDHPQNQSIIAEGSPVEHIVQAVMALCH